MIVKLAEHYGLCFGVRDAIAQAERLADEGPLTILGELVHNPVVRERLAARGVREGRLENPGARQDQGARRNGGWEGGDIAGDSLAWSEVPGRRDIRSFSVNDLTLGQDLGTRVVWR